MSDCKRLAFLSYFPCLSSFLSLRFFQYLLYLTLCKTIGCQSPTTNATRSKMLRILVNFDSLVFLYRFALFFRFLLLLHFSLVGSAHTRTLFVKSVAKTFVFYAIKPSNMLIQPSFFSLSCVFLSLTVHDTSFIPNSFLHTLKLTLSLA